MFPEVEEFFLTVKCFEFFVYFSGVTGIPFHEEKKKSVKALIIWSE